MGWRASRSQAPVAELRAQLNGISETAAPMTQAEEVLHRITPVWMA